MRRSIVVIAVSLAVVPAVAGQGAVARVASHGARPSRAEASAAGRAIVSQWRSRQREAATAAATVAGIAFHRYESLEAAGDLKGHRPDVLDVREISLGHGARVLGVTARVGATGKVLWHRTVSEPKGTNAFVLPERVGRAGEPGVVALTFSDTARDGTRSMREQIRALAGGTGHVLWSRTLTGTARGSALANVPTFDGQVDASAHAAPSYLFTRQSKVSSEDQSTAVEVNGSTGAVSRVGKPVRSTSGYPTYAVAPDLNGDGLGDVLLLTNGADGSMKALSSANGSTIWTGAEIDTLGFAFAQAIPDYSSSSVDDIAFSGLSPSGDDIDEYVVSGATGQVLWSKPGFGAIAIGVAGKKRLPAVGIDNITGGGGSGHYVTFHDSYSAIGVNGAAIYKKRVSVSILGSGDDSSGSGLSETIGDVQLDGSLDTLVSLSVQSGSAKLSRTKTLRGEIDGRTGDFYRVAAQTGADGSLRRGKATDLLAVHVVHGSPQITAWRGSNRHRYYQRSVATVTGVRSAYLSGLRVTGHSCSDISLTASAPKKSTIGIIDAAGSPLWTVTFSSRSATGGVLHRFKAPKHFCV